MKRIKYTMASCGFPAMLGTVVDKIPAAPQTVKQTAAARRRRYGEPGKAATATATSRSAVVVRDGSVEGSIVVASCDLS